MAERPERPRRSWWRKLLGDDPQSWRRMVAYGVGAGVALAVVAALVAAGFGGVGGSLDDKPAPTAAVIDSGEPPVDEGPFEVDPTEEPVVEATEVPVDEPTEEPVATEPVPTDEPIEEATPTEEPIEGPTDVPTVVGGA